MSRHLETAEVKAAVKDDRRWCDIGVVVVLDGDDKHYQLLRDDAGTLVDVLVGVKLGHTGESFPCRLGCVAGRAGGFGLWTIPPVGTEVIVAVPTGEFEADSVIVGMCASGSVPSDVDEDTVVLRAPKNVIIETNGGDVNITASGKVNLQGGDQPIARKTDTVDLGTFQCDGVGTAFAGIKWIPPGASGVTEITAAAAVAVTGKISSGSSKAGCG